MSWPRPCSVDRYEYERAIEASRLDGPCCALASALARRLNRETGAIPPHAQPSLAKLARLCGYGVSTVKRHLTHLSAAGWVRRDPPPVWLAQTEHATTSYTLMLPAGYPQARPSLRRAHGPARAMAGANTGREPSPAAPVGSAQPGPQTRRGQPGDTGQQPDDALVRVAQDELSALMGREVAPGVAAEAARQILAGRAVPRPGPYLRAALRADPGRWLPRPVRDSDRSAAEAIAEALAT